MLDFSAMRSAEVVYEIIHGVSCDDSKCAVRASSRALGFGTRHGRGGDVIVHTEIMRPRTRSHARKGLWFTYHSEYQSSRVEFMYIYLHRVTTTRQHARILGITCIHTFLSPHTRVTTTRPRQRYRYVYPIRIPFTRCALGS